MVALGIKRRWGFRRSKWRRALARTSEVTLTATETLLLQIKGAGLPRPEREYRFDAKRRWRFDLSWRRPHHHLPLGNVAVEIHGAIYTQGRHVRGQGFEADREKVNEAQLQGWVVIECTEAQIESGQALSWIERALGVNGVGVKYFADRREAKDAENKD